MQHLHSSTCPPAGGTPAPTTRVAVEPAAYWEATALRLRLMRALLPLAGSVELVAEVMPAGAAAGGGRGRGDGGRGSWLREPK